MIKFERLPADILSRIPHVKRVLLEDENIVFAYLFGGLAKGELKPLSDVDISVYVKDIGNLPEYKLKLFDALTEILRTNEMDLVILNTAPVILSGKILQNKQSLVDKNPPLRHAYESLTLRKYFDFTVKEKALFSRRYGPG
jgi:predicted nucleotidyltransferase